MRQKAWIILTPVALALVGFLVWKALWRPAGPDPLAPLEESWELRRQEKIIRALEEQVARLTRELEEKTKQIEVLQSRLGEPMTEYRVEEKSPPTKQSPPNEISLPKVQFYTTVRTTSVFEVPSDTSRKLATLPKGITLRVVGSTDAWLEVRSKRGRPPGYVRKEDAVPSTTEN